MKINAYMRRKTAFTLSEVLIALVIIGVIAVMTVFTLQARIEQAKRNTAIKKAYNTLISATNKFKFDNGGDLLLPSVPDSGNNYSVPSRAYMEEYAKYMNAQIKCNNNNDCFDKEVWYRYTPTGGSYFMSGFITPDGVSWRFYFYSPSCSYNSEGYPYTRCGEIQFDINGPKPPNTKGKDIFQFYVKGDGTFVPLQKAALSKIISEKTD